MKTTKSVAAVLAAVCSIASALEDPCDSVLLPSIEVASLDHLSSMEYFSRVDENTWEQRKNEKEFNSSFNILVEGVPLGGEGAASFKEFDERRRAYFKKIEYRADNRSAHEYFRSSLSEAQVRAWINCQMARGRFGFSIIEREVTDSAVTLEIIWIHPPGAPDPLPEYTTSVVGGRVASPLVPTATLFPQGYPLTQGSHVATILRDGDTDLTVTISAGGGLGVGTYKKDAPAKLALAAAIPLGSVISSMLPPQRYAEATGESSRFDGTKSRWVPADGRRVAGSRYSEIIGGAVPDLRGMFLRGLNEFEPGLQRADGYQDPDGSLRRAGQMQGDEFKSHDHKLLGENWMQAMVDGSGVFNDGNSQAKKLTTNPTTTAAGGEETRPKNVAVYYYIRIN
ncbi:hypothetical protein [Luteolibacter luteus]|uniref:Phage tail collar domain-containing protein n=1 Tax=Luteolibacter luteus TaxID=2728835 RepID=A0A858RRQ5_9BACT|nr:hypothetical protein [Luteolibacter luteus]QJE98623.1 hypothetical protein HHL09_23505 [Luteolibacter luteus]